MPSDEQYQLELSDHVQRARVVAQAVRRLHGELFVVGHRDQFGLSHRHNTGPEVEWTDKMWGLTYQQARDIVDAGVCKPWLDCLAKPKAEPHINKGYDKDIPTELEKHIKFCREGKFDGCVNLPYWAEAAVKEIRSLRKQLAAR